MPVERDCAACVRELRPALERRMALELWRGLQADALQAGLADDALLPLLRTRLEARTGLDLGAAE